jgi:hypothetical protein
MILIFLFCQNAISSILIMPSKYMEFVIFDVFLRECVTAFLVCMAWRGRRVWSQGVEWNTCIYCTCIICVMGEAVLQAIRPFAIVRL